MTRGKHAATAAKRRAESAEEQLDRLLPKLVEAQQKAQRYETAAAMTPVLQRQLEELRRTNGVPVAEHEQAVREAYQECDRLLAGFEEVVTTFVQEIIRIGVLIKEPKGGYISSDLLTTLHALPEAAVQAVTRHFGWTRDLKRCDLLAAADHVYEEVYGKRLKGGLVEFSPTSETGKAYARHLEFKRLGVREKPVRIEEVLPNGSLRDEAWKQLRAERAARAQAVSA